MIRNASVVVLFGTIFAASAAFADDDCHSPMASWQPREALLAAAESQGWSVAEIEVDDGCYEVKARDESGHRLKATFEPETLKLIEIERGSSGDGDDDDDEDDDDDDHGGRAANTPGPTTPPPPRNPLIGKPKATVN